jgi:hypothetical protein
VSDPFDQDTWKAKAGERAWIGVDLDGTLAVHNHVSPGRKPGDWDGISIGPPVPAMVARVKAWLAQGKNVRILTARASSLHPPEELAATTEAIHAWCAEHLGKVLPVTAEKDYYMVELWDDRAIGVQRDTGTPERDIAYAEGWGDACHQLGLEDE